jgi:hypothetical protein
MSDLAQYGEIDVWSSPLVTFANGAGDCEDYAIAKFVALRLAGIAPEDLRIVVMRDTVMSGTTGRPSSSIKTASCAIAPRRCWPTCRAAISRLR